MPKVGITEREWKERLELYVQGRFEFGRGQRPPKKSKRAIKLQAVESCPKHKNPQQKDPLGRSIQCKCGYHKVSSSNVNNEAVQRRTMCAFSTPLLTVTETMVSCASHRMYRGLVRTIGCGTYCISSSPLCDSTIDNDSPHE